MKHYQNGMTLMAQYKLIQSCKEGNTVGPRPLFVQNNSASIVLLSKPKIDIVCFYHLHKCPEQADGIIL